MNLFAYQFLYQENEVYVWKFYMRFARKYLVYDKALYRLTSIHKAGRWRQRESHGRRKIWTCNSAWLSRGLQSAGSILSKGHSVVWAVPWAHSGNREGISLSEFTWQNLSFLPGQSWWSRINPQYLDKFLWTPCREQFLWGRCSPLTPETAPSRFSPNILQT